MMKGIEKGQSPFAAAVETLSRLLRDCGVAVPESASREALVTPGRLAVEAWLGPVLRQSSTQTRDACRALAGIAPLLCWRQNPTYADGALLAGYGYCELVGPRGHWVDKEMSLGVLLLAPTTLYPPHRHPATEDYVVLAGGAYWQVDHGPWRRLDPGAAIHHPSMAVHAMRTDTSPLLAAYLWTDHLDTPATLVRDRAT